MIRYEMQELANGQFRLERVWTIWGINIRTGKFLDLRSPVFSHSPSSCFYRDCLGTRQQAERCRLDIVLNLAGKKSISDNTTVIKRWGIE